MPGVLWRSVTVSGDMVDPLDELARLSGDDIYVKPILGYGSYSTNKSSAGIDTGGGHVDLDLAGLTALQKLRLERLARMIGFYADIREPRWWSPVRQKFITATWQSHLHMVKKDAPDRSIPARAQLASWYAGTNGLAGFDWNEKYQHDPDDGPREFLNQTWVQYLAAKDDLDMTPQERQALINDIADAVERKILRKRFPDPDGKATIQDHIYNANLRASKLQTDMVQLMAEVGKVSASSGASAADILSEMADRLRE